MSFVEYLGSGNITSNEYNTALTVVMDTNGDLLNLEEATLFDEGPINNKSRHERIAPSY
jgi:hypothetical protein